MKKRKTVQDGHTKKRPHFDLGNNSYRQVIYGLIAIACILFSNEKSINAQIRSHSHGFNYLDKDWVPNDPYGAGYSFYSAVYPVMNRYPGPENFQTGLVSVWMSPRGTGSEPDEFYTTIEGGLGWWSDTRFATETPKFIMGGVSYNFYSWANGVGAGQSDLINEGYRDWSEPGGKYGVAQLSPNLLWPPDGLNMEQGANGEFLGYGYHPLPITEPVDQSDGMDRATGNQCWTLFLNANNFKGPVTFFVPTFWTEPVQEDARVEGLLLDVQPAGDNIGLATEHASTPALISDDHQYATLLPRQFPITSENRSALAQNFRVYGQNALWDDMKAWFNGGAPVSPGLKSVGTRNLRFYADGEVTGGISTLEGPEVDLEIDCGDYIGKYVSNDGNVIGYEWDPNIVQRKNEHYTLPDYFKRNQSNQWVPINRSLVPRSSGLLDNSPPIEPLVDPVPYLTPMEPDCHFQDPNGPWKSPGPASGPFKVQLGDGTILTYYWYRFVDQPAIVHAGLPENQLRIIQDRVEKIHRNWSYKDEFIAPPSTGELVNVDAGLIVKPPSGMEFGYVPIVTRQEAGVLPPPPPPPPVDENLALAGAASQSSNYSPYFGLASEAIDGNTNGAWSGNSVTHTRKDVGAWWQVELETAENIGEINIFNRTDCCSQRLSNFTVFVLDENDLPVWSKHFTNSPSPSITTDAEGAFGKTIKIQLDGQAYLSLAEVEVYESENVTQPNKSLNHLDIVTIKAETINRYVSCENAKLNENKPVNANREDAQEWEEYELNKLSDGKFAFKALQNDLYLCSESNRQSMTCNRGALLSWEKFTLVPLGNSVYALRGNNNRYVTHSQGSNGTQLTCSATEIGALQRFIIDVIPNLPKSESNVLSNNTKSGLEQIEFELFPNPAKDKLNLKISPNQEFNRLEIVIKDLSGKEHYVKNYSAQNGVISDEIDLSSFAIGLYVVTMKTDDRTEINTKFVKQ